LLFTSITYKTPEFLERAVDNLVSSYGEIAYRSDELKFDKTDYYESEMGKGLNRVFVAYDPLIERDQLSEKKLIAVKVEQSYTEDDCRLVNIDPGLLSFENILLSTCKNFSHRIYIGKGVFAEVTLIHKGGNYQSLEWTYPDYASDKIKLVLNEMREKYKELLRCENA